MATLFDASDDGASGPYTDDALDAAAAGQARAARSGAQFKQIATGFLAKAGGHLVRPAYEIDRYPNDGEFEGPNGRRFLVLARGTPDDEGKEPGLKRTDTIEKVGYRILQISRRCDLPIIVLTSDLPTTPKACTYLADLTSDVWDVVAWRGDLRGFQRLRSAFNEEGHLTAPDAPWRHRPVTDDGDQMVLSLEPEAETEAQPGQPA